MAENNEPEIKIIVDQASLYRSDSGSIIGVIYLATDSFDFPGVGWSDFPVVILSWWLQAAVRLANGHSLGADCDFMDGPFLVAVTPMGGRSVRLDCIQRNQKRQILATAPVNFAEFCSELLKAAKVVERACMQRGWESDNIMRLTQSIGSLELQLMDSSQR